MARAKSSYIFCLKRRVEYLTEKVNADLIGGSRFHFVRQEIAALNWALPILAAYLAANKKVDDE